MQTCVLHARSPPDERATGGRAKESQIANLVIRSCLSVYKALDGTFVGSAVAKRSPAYRVPFVGDRQRREAVAAGGSPRTPKDETGQILGKRTSIGRQIRDGRPNPANALRPVSDPLALAIFGHIIAEPGKGPAR